MIDFSRQSSAYRHAAIACIAVAAIVIPALVWFGRPDPLAEPILPYRDPNATYSLTPPPDARPLGPEQAPEMVRMDALATALVLVGFAACPVAAVILYRLFWPAEPVRW